MKKYGYVRVSAQDQNESRQLIAMENLGIAKANVFIDKQSGKNTSRPGLRQLLEIVCKGDTVIVESVSRFARNTRDLLELIDKLTEKGVEFISLKEHIDTTTPTGKFMLTVFGAVAELERGYILQRQAEGIAAAKARGVKFGRPEKPLPGNFASLVNQWEQGRLQKSDILAHCGDICEMTFYRRLREHRIIQNSKPR